MFPIAGASPSVAALVEPVSIAMRAVHRGRIAAGERVVVLGAGPIGQSLLVAAQDRGAAVLLVDLLEDRLETARALGRRDRPVDDGGRGRRHMRASGAAATGRRS